jgi:N-methylhydantoinase A
VVSYRVRVRVTVPKFEPRTEPAPVSPRSPDFAVKGRRRVHLSADTSVEARLYERDRLDIGSAITGPAIVEQFDSTTVIPPGWTARVDGYRNLILERA